MKQKYPHIKGMKDIATATLNAFTFITYTSQLRFVIGPRTI